MVTNIVQPSADSEGNALIDFVSVNTTGLLRKIAKQLDDGDAEAAKLELASLIASFYSSYSSRRADSQMIRSEFEAIEQDASGSSSIERAINMAKNLNREVDAYSQFQPPPAGGQRK